MNPSERVAEFNHDLGASKIFCLSIQRSGTTSIGDFLESFDLTRAGWRVSQANDWGRLGCEKKYEEIFSSRDFLSANVFEDGPWWYPRFYEVLYQYFPRAKFILAERDADAWFKSMCLHSAGRNPGHTGRHCMVYEREEDLDWMVENLGLNPDLNNQIDITCSAGHYKRVYERHHTDCRTFFADKPESLLHVRLEDSNLFADIAKFLGLSSELPRTFHANRSSRSAHARLGKYLRRMQSGS